MPLFVSCPDCSKKLRVPDTLLGKKVKCPGCTRMFMAEGTPEQGPDEEAPAKARTGARTAGVQEKPRLGRQSAAVTSEELDEVETSRPRYRPRYEEEDDRPARRRRRYDDDDEDYDSPPPRDNAAWKRVRTGLNLVLLAGWLVLSLLGIGAITAGVMLLVAGSFITGAANASNPDQVAGSAASSMVGGFLGMLLFILIVGVVGLAEVAMRLIGLGMCMATPQRFGGARTMAIAAFAASLVATVLPMLSHGMGVVGVRTGVAGQSFGSLCGVAAWILWLIYLYMVSNAVRDREAASSVVKLAIASGIYWASMFLVVPLMFFLGLLGVASSFSGGSATGTATGIGVTAVLVMLFAGAVVLVGLGLYIWYLTVVQRVRDAVGRAARR